MQHNEYNWYSTNSAKRYQRIIIQHQARPSQFSDDGRYPLGSASDPENVEMRRQIIQSVSEETLKEWDDYRKNMRDKCLLRKRQMGSRHEEVDERFRTYPVKKSMIEEDLENDTHGSDASQQGRNDYDRSKYVLIRKTNPVTTTTAHDSPLSTAENDQIFVDDREPSASQVRWVVSGKEELEEKQVTSTDSHYQKPKQIVTSPDKKSKIGTSEKTQTLIVTIPSTTEECILNKYGHCFAPAICPFAHNGVVRKIEGKKVTAPVWQRKLPNTALCSGYLNFECWNFNCENRHILYPSDVV